jgi:phosphatidylglycerol lysyltransferase
MLPDRLSRVTHKIAQFVPMVLFALALFIVHKQLQSHNFTEILQSLHNTPWYIGLWALLLTVINYLVLVGYDGLALRFTGHKQIPWLKIIPPALLSYSISNNTGHAWAAGGSVRYRFYSKWGVPGWDIIKISIFQSTTYLLGALTLGLLGSLLLPRFLAHSVQEPASIKWVSIVCAASLLVYWGAVCLWRKPIRIKDFELYLPTPTMAIWQTLVASLDVVLSSLVLWVLLLGQVDISFGAFLAVFVVAQVLGVISQVPGGLGVFESAFLWLMSTIEAHDQHLTLIAALLLYRLIYYFVPLFFAGCGLFAYELYNRRQTLLDTSLAFSRILTAVVPQLYSVLLFFSGSLLLIAGIFPLQADLDKDLQDLLVLPIIEFSHLLGSLIGLLLIFVARGIRLKIDAAWYASLVLLATGALMSVLKGWHWLEALVLLVVLLLLLPARSHFQRRSSLLHMPFTKSWLIMTAMVLISATWLGFFVYRDVEYAHELWWQFSYDGNAPRFLRAGLLLSVVCVSYGLLRLLSVAPPRFLNKPDAAELNEAQSLVKQYADTHGFLALLGDKYLFWNAKRNAFIMFAITPQFWIAMGDPIGAPDAFEELFWLFREQADFNGAKAVFYQVSAELLPYYLDQGLSLFKLGEEARIDLSLFKLEGKQREDQRSARNKFTKLHFSFEILSAPADIEAALPRLKQISDAWLLNKNTREKGFSLGFFAEAYLRHTEIAVVKDEEGEIKAFANLWKTQQLEELSIDLMRYDPTSPKGIMDYLFTELLLWGKAENYRWFSLGMAPLAGLERHPLAPLWHKIGTIIFDMGDQFYNFEGLYGYKAKFAPHWQPRYLAAPASLSVPYILMVITRLISGGWQGVFAK